MRTIIDMINQCSETISHVPSQLIQLQQKVHVLTYLLYHDIYPASRLQLPPQQSKRVLRERKQAFAIPLRLLNTNLLLLRCVNNLDIRAINSMHLDLLSSRKTLELRLKVLLLMDIHHSEVHNAVLIQRRADVQPGRLYGASDPRGVRVAQVLAAAEVDGDGGAAHVLAVQQEGPPGGLLEDAVLCGHERGDDVDALGNVGHADVLGLADEDVEPDGDGEGVGEVVFLFCAFFAGGALGIPDVPLVEADLLATDGGRDVVLNAGEIDETGCDLNGTLSRPRGCTLLVSIQVKSEIYIPVAFL
jgi:hypothetical protein